MKKLLGIVVLSLLLSGNAYAKIGKGEIQLSEKVTNDFIKFLRNEYANYFMVTPDGNNSLYTICGAEFCKGGMGKALKWCKEDNGQKCLIFAQRKKQTKIIRWNKADYSFPKDDWNYNVMVNVEYLKSDNKGIKQNISDDQIKGVLNNLGFINFNKAVASIDTNTSKQNRKNNNGAEYFCVWTGTGEYTNILWFTQSLHYDKISKQNGSKNTDCRKKAIYIIYKQGNDKLYKKLMWKFENRSNPDQAQIRLSKSLYKKVQNEIAKNTQTFEEEIVKTTQSNESKTIPKIEKKLTQQQQIEIDQIKEMFDIGAITKDEYDNAVKRVLN